MDKILVVDDEADIRRAFHRNLASDTLQVVDAGNGEEAIRMIAKERPNLVLMDTESYEEAHIPRDLLGDAAPFLQDNMQVTVDLVEGDPVG